MNGMTLRAHLEAIRDRVGDPHVRRSANLNYQDAVAAIALLDAAHRADAHERGDGLVVIPDTPRSEDDA